MLHTPSALQRVVKNIQREVNVIPSPSQKIITLLQRIQQEYNDGYLSSSETKLSSAETSSMIHSLNYAIEKIGHRIVYLPNTAAFDDFELALRRRPCMQKFWINEFSKLGFQKMRQRSLKKQL